MAKKSKKTTTDSLSTHPGKSVKPPEKEKISRKSSNKAEMYPLTDDEQFSLRNMIKQQLSQYIRQTKIQEDLTESLTTMVQEYLSCFVLLGYTFDGTPVTTISVESQQDADAIGTMIHRFINQSHRMNPPGQGPFPGDPPTYE
jgi:hypothetical protein